MEEYKPTQEAQRAGASEADSVANLIGHGDTVCSIQPSEVRLYRFGVRLTAIAAAIIFLTEIVIIRIL